MGTNHWFGTLVWFVSQANRLTHLLTPSPLYSFGCPSNVLIFLCAHPSPTYPNALPPSPHAPFPLILHPFSSYSPCHPPSDPPDRRQRCGHKEPKGGCGRARRHTRPQKFWICFIWAKVHVTLAQIKQKQKQSHCQFIPAVGTGPLSLDLHLGGWYQVK